MANRSWISLAQRHRRLSLLAQAMAFLALVEASPGSAAAQAVFYEERFDAPSLDASKWITEMVTSGPRWCDVNAGHAHGPGTWVPDGEPACYGAEAQSPYGSAWLEGGLLRLSSTIGRAFPTLTSRWPGPVQVFPAEGDFTVRIRVRFDQRTGAGVGCKILQAESTAPEGSLEPDSGPMLMQVWADPGIRILSSLGGAYYSTVALVSAAPNEFHEYSLAYEAGSYSMRVDGSLVYGPIESAVRPTAVSFGNPVLSYWGALSWTSLSVDYVRVEVPAPTVTSGETWGRLKHSYR